MTLSHFCDKNYFNFCYQTRGIQGFSTNSALTSFDIIGKYFNTAAIYPNVYVTTYYTLTSKF